MASVAKRKWTYQGKAREAWVVRYKDKSGAHRSKQFDLKKAADAYCRQVENELESGVHVARSLTVTVARLYEDFMDHANDQLNNGAIGLSNFNNYKTLLSHAVRNFGNVALTDLTWQMVEDFGATLRRTRSPQTGRPYKASTVVNIVKTFRVMLDYGVRRDYVARNVADTAIKVLNVGVRDKITPFTKDELKSLIAATEDRRTGRSARRSGPLFKAMVYLGAFCGLRLGEIAALRSDDIDFDKSIIYVRHSLTRFDELKGPKTAAGRRDVPLPSYVAEAIQAAISFAVPNDRGYIFRTRAGGNLHASGGFRSYWAWLVDLAGISREADGTVRHFHALRHYAGSSWLEAGIPLADVSRLLGHASTAVTAQVYMHALGTNQLKATAMETCGALLLPAPKGQITQELRNAA